MQPLNPSNQPNKKEEQATSISVGSVSASDEGAARRWRDRMAISKWRPVIIAVVAVGAVFLVGGLFPPDAWFEQLAKPTWQPPDWVFAPVWSLLYAMIAVSLGLVLAAPPDRCRRNALFALAVVLLLNAAWSPLFFGLHSPLLAFIDIVALWLASIVSIALVARVSGFGALLLVPSLLWVTFALILNGVIMALNP